MVWRPSVPFAPPLRACGSTGVLLAVGRQAFGALENLAGPHLTRKAWDTAFSRLDEHEAFVLINGRRGQRGDVIGQTGTMVLRWCRRERPHREDRVLQGGKCDSCLFQ